MKTAKVVIGANYGDEGKGMTVDWLCSKTPNALVVRFNGGAQAGHTVVTPEGKRHVFGHFGSGTFVGCPTHLSRFFITNPLLFMKELGELNHPTKVTVDPRSIVTTPYDMLINQIAEHSRGSERHGSCGVGINETIERNKIVPLSVYDLQSIKRTEYILKVIEEEWLPHRLNVLKITTIPMQFKMILESPLNHRFLNVCEKFLRRITIVPDNKIDYDDIIFEGAQGLLLDQSCWGFPYLTRSNTGLNNVIDIIKGFDYKGLDLDVYYVTRTYLTRHGPGPLKDEYTGITSNMIDETNKENQFQGKLRYAPLHIETMNVVVEHDVLRTKMLFPDNNEVTTHFNWVLTHFDMFEHSDILSTLAKTFNKEPIISIDKTREGFI